MAPQRVTMRLTELRCLAQSERGGSEPYLWTTYFAFGDLDMLGPGPLTIDTPSYNEFREEFPDQMKAGQVITVPEFVGTSSFDMDLASGFYPKMIGCIAVLLEQDSTPKSSIILGRIAYSKEIDLQLNALVKKRIMAGNTSALTDAEIDAVKAAVKTKVKDAIKSDQSLWNVFTDQDDIIGVVYKLFRNASADDPNAEIKSQHFDFPEIANGSSNRFVLSGTLSVGPIPAHPVDLCAKPRAALKAKTDQISALENRIASLQSLLQHASPPQKAAIIQQITTTDELATEAEAQLPALQAALGACLSRSVTGGVVTGTTIGVDPRP